MSWIPPTTFPPALTEVLGVTLTFQRLIAELKRLVSKRGYSLAQIASEVGLTQVTVRLCFSCSAYFGLMDAT